MASRIAVMSEGRFLQVGAPAEIYETPASRFVADFIGNVNLMDGTLVEDEPDHVVVDCADCRHCVGHGITGTRRHGGDGGGAAGEDPHRRGAPSRRPSARRRLQPGAGHGQATWPTSAASPSTTCSSPSGRVLKISQSNTERQRGGAADLGRRGLGELVDRCRRWC